MLLTAREMHLEKIAESGQCFRWERLGDGAFRIPHKNACLTIRPLGAGRFSLDCPEEEFNALWKPYFDLETDYAFINGRIDAGDDPFLYASMTDQRGIRILRQDAWEMLITSIITQNRNIPAIQRSVALLCALGGERKTDRAGNAYFTFPTPAQLCAMDGESLRQCRLGYRESYVRKAAESVCSGALCLKSLSSLPDEACREVLLRQYGIGEKVAACVMLFGLHRLNAFPRDVWMNRVLMAQYPSGFPFDRYAPYNGVYQQYLFAYYRKIAA